MANTTVESLIQKFAESKGTGKERPGKMTDSTRRHIHISHSVTSVFAFLNSKIAKWSLGDT